MTCSVHHISLLSNSFSAPVLKVHTVVVVVEATACARRSSTISSPRHHAADKALRIASQLKCGRRRPAHENAEGAVVIGR